jgi:hypothetical protein
VGSGTGKVCNLVGFCYGCPTKGIELVQDRYVVGEELLKELIHLHNENFVGDNSKVWIPECRFYVVKFLVSHSCLSLSSLHTAEASNRRR